MAVTAEYLVVLRDAFSAAAERIAKAAQLAKTNVGHMGQAANEAERSVASAASALMRAGGSMVGLQRDAAGAQKAFVGVGTAARQAAAEVVAARDSAWAKAGFARGPDGLWVRPSPNDAPGGGGFLNKAFGAWFGAQLGSMAVHGADHLVGRAASVDTMREKMRYALGGDLNAVEAAYQKAFELSGRYKNTSVAENLKIIDDLRANLPESFDHILKESTEPFVRLHGFFKAWEGGRHVAKGEQALKDISIAIRSGELMGNLSGADLAHHAQQVAAARIVFGEKFKLSEYFMAQKVAAAAINAADDTFKHVDFPVLVQALGQRAGMGLATLYNKTVGGIMVRQNSAELWRELGMVDMSQVRLDKKGRIDPRSLVGKNWLKGGDLAGTNPTEWINRVLIPHLAPKVGFDGELWKKTWEAGAVHRLAQLQKAIDRNKLSKVLAGLGYDRTAVMEMDELILRAPNILRDREQMKKVLRDIEKYASYDKAKQAFGAQVDRLFLALTGKEFTPAIVGMIDELAAAVSRLADAANGNPLLGKGIMIVTGLIAAIAAVKALTWSMRVLGVTAAMSHGWRFLAWLTGASAAATRLGFALRMIRGLSVIGMIGYEAWQHWDKLAPIVERVANALKSMGKDVAGWWNNSDEYKKRMEDYAKGQSAWEQKNPGGFWGLLQDRIYGPKGIAASTASSMLSGAVAEREITVRTTLDPIKVEAPPSVRVEVTGSGISGNGNIPLSVKAPRGQATPEASR
ncbi:MAG: hypothetical protein F9K29_03410 [Hyphomicrobiaceae bacterium]|nr:MAG: hypothetical protein F9K29_03410 [Hyphomicrobiaceae bacterium]